MVMLPANLVGNKNLFKLHVNNLKNGEEEIE